MSELNPIGAISLAKDCLRNSLANCSHFQAFGGSQFTVEEALKRIYFDGLPTAAVEEYSRQQWEALRPFAIVFMEESTFDLAASPNGFLRNGKMVVRFEDNVPKEYQNDPQDAAIFFENSIGQIITSDDPGNPGLVELMQQAQYLGILNVRYSGVMRPDYQEIMAQGDHQFCFVSIDWGQGSA